MPRARNLAPLTLEQRLAADLAMTGGQMPLAVIVADDEERFAALRWLHGRKGGQLLTVLTQAESEARRKETG